MGSFFDEYKSLDRLCKDIFDSENGVTEYIERMEREERGRMLVADWDRDYKKLKSMRYIRNKIAHEDGISEDDVCSPSDTSWLMEFQERIMNEDDPLTVLYNYDASQNGTEDDFPDYPDINEKTKPVKKATAKVRESSEPKPKRESNPRRKASTPEPEIPSFKPRIDFVSALAAILLLIGVATAIIVSCI